MNPAAMLVLAHVLAAAPATCFTADDATPGWKAAHVPSSAPSLSAPDGVPQFRSGEPATVSYSERDGLMSASGDGAGRMRFELSLPHGARNATLEFAEDLRGAKVDAYVWAGGRYLPLLDEKRMTGKTIALDWTFEDVSSLTVVVHHHFRDAPIVERWRFTSAYDVATASDTPAPFKEPRVLYYLQPPGPPVELCDVPGRARSLAHVELRGEPQHVALVRRP